MSWNKGSSYESFRGGKYDYYNEPDYAGDWERYGGKWNLGYDSDRHDIAAGSDYRKNDIDWNSSPHGDVYPAKICPRDTSSHHMTDSRYDGKRPHSEDVQLVVSDHRRDYHLSKENDMPGHRYPQYNSSDVRKQGHAYGEGQKSTGSSQDSSRHTFVSKTFFSNSLKKASFPEKDRQTQAADFDGERTKNMTEMDMAEMKAVSTTRLSPENEQQETAFQEEGTAPVDYSDCSSVDLDNLSVHTVDVKSTHKHFFTISDVMRTLRQRKIRNRRPELYHNEEKDQLDKELGSIDGIPNMVQQLTKLHREHNR